MEILEAPAPKPERPVLKALRKIFISTTGRVVAAILIALLFAHVLTSYSNFRMMNNPQLVVFVDSVTGVNYVGSVFGPNTVRLNADGTIFRSGQEN